MVAMKKKILLSVLHAFFLLGMTWFWLNDFRVLGDEQALIKASSEFKRDVLNVEDDLPGAEELVFINVDHDLALIPRDPKGLKQGKEVITDRKLLADFFHLLNRFPDAYRYVVCDIFFEGDDAGADDALAAELARMERIIAPSHRQNGGVLEPKFDVPHALADYQSVKGAFYKWQLMEDDGLKTLPLAFYETLHGREMRKKGWFYAMDGKLCFNRMIIDLKIRESLLTGDKPRYPYFDSIETLAEGRDQPTAAIAPFIDEYFKDRIIVIGTFNRDAHATALGKMGGALILMNVYYSLAQGQHYISIGLILLLLAVYVVISYHVFFKIPVKLPLWLQDFLKTKGGKFIEKYLSILGALLLTSILCYIFFDAHINILFITLYIHVIKDIKKRGEKRLGDVDETMERAASSVDPSSRGK